MKFTSAVLATLVATSLAIALRAQVQDRPIPRMVKKDGRFALFVDDAPYLMWGAQVHNSSTWPVHHGPHANVDGGHFTAEAQVVALPI